MEKRNYITPTVSYVGPDVPECKETNSPIAMAVATSVANNVTTAIISKIW